MVLGNLLVRRFDSSTKVSILRSSDNPGGRVPCKPHSLMVRLTKVRTPRSQVGMVPDLKVFPERWTMAIPLLDRRHRHRQWHHRRPPRGRRRPSPSVKEKNWNDRFIPDRSSVDFDMARTLFTSIKKHQDPVVTTADQEVYQKRLADCLLQGRSRIIGFKAKASAASSDFETDCILSKKKTRYISKHPESQFYVEDLMDDFYLNLVDWGSKNVLAIALHNVVSDNIVVLDPSTGLTSAGVALRGVGPVTSVSWAADGQRLAIGLENSTVLIYDVNTMQLLRILRGPHRSRVGSLAWNDDLLATGGMDGKIVLNDVRRSSHILRTYKGHQREVCGLKWSESGRRLASGGDDNRLHVWDLVKEPTRNQWLFRFEEHKAAVKALVWCPFNRSLLASGGGPDDQCIKLWDVNVGACLNSVNTGSQISALLWNKNENELLSSHGFTSNQLTLWKYPSMVRMVELEGHKSRAVFLALSPDGCTVASAGGNDVMRFWNVFGDPKAKSAKAANRGSFPVFTLLSGKCYGRRCDLYCRGSDAMLN